MLGNMSKGLAPVAGQAVVLVPLLLQRLVILGSFTRFHKDQILNYEFYLSPLLSYLSHVLLFAVSQPAHVSRCLHLAAYQSAKGKEGHPDQLDARLEEA